MASARGVVLLALLANCATFHPFRADIGSIDVDGQMVHPPYMATLAYFGYLAPENLSVADDANQSPFLYLWLANAVPELGLRAVSPTGDMPPPMAGRDTVDGAFRAHNKEAGFDTCVRVERCQVLTLPHAGVSRCERWLPLGANEDSAEVPEGTDGRATNALLRVVSSHDDALFALVRGLYRVQVAHCAARAQSGPFVLEVGAPMSLDGAALARSEAALAARLRGLNEHVPLVVQPARGGFVGAPGEGVYTAPLPDNLAPAVGPHP